MDTTKRFVNLKVDSETRRLVRIISAHKQQTMKDLMRSLVIQEYRRIFDVRKTNPR